MLRQTPGLEVTAPSSLHGAKGPLKSAIRYGNPVVLVEHRYVHTGKGVVPEEEYTEPIGRAVARCEGKDVIVVAYLVMEQVAMQATELLAADGIEADRIGPRTLAPFDPVTAAAPVRTSGHLLIVCQEPMTGCFDEGTAYRAQELPLPDLKCPAQAGAAYNIPPHMAQTLESESFPGPQRVATAAKAMIGG
jgi:pyruvate dehydrogenase E1 component beta subunit